MEEFSKVTVPDMLPLECAQEPAKSKIQTVRDTGQIIDGHMAIPVQVISRLPDVVSVAQQKPAYNFSGKTVLVVDDVSFNLSLIDMFFKNTGAQMLFAANGREALDTCISNPHVDIVLMDIQMPVMNGLEATREILKLKPEMPVIAITAYVHSDDKQRCFDAGCTEFMSKPCNRKDLLMIVNNYFQVMFSRI